MQRESENEMKPTPLNLIDEDLVEFNRIRYRNELAHGIYELMKTQGVNRTKLAELLGVQKSRVTHFLTGEKNLQADTLADILLVLGRTPHLVLATDFDAVRFAADEGIESQNQSATATTEFKDYGQTYQETKPLENAPTTNIVGRIGFPGAPKFVRLAY